MTKRELLTDLQDMDFTGTLAEVLARFTPEQLTAFKEAINARTCDPVLYFAVRRYGVERATPITINLDMQVAQRITHQAEMLITLEVMRRDGHVLVDYPTTRFADPTQRQKIQITEEGQK